MQSFNELWDLGPIAAMALMASSAKAQKASVAAAAGKNLLDEAGYAGFSDGGPRAVVSPAMSSNLGIEIGAHL